MKFEYVMSGAAHTRITLKNVPESHISGPLRKIFDKAQGQYNHNYTCLYNAYTESANGKTLYDANIIGHDMHADSGGLQVVTRGHKIDKKIKDMVYKSQAEHSGIAMCFDEIPVVTKGISAVGDIVNRFFDRSLVLEKAKATAANIVEQAEYFKKQNTTARIMMIVQGYDYDSYMQWVDECYKNIPSELQDMLCGIAIAGSSSGNGRLEDVERAWSFSRLQCPEEWKKRLHLLGVGASRRMLPFTGLGINLYHPDCIVSYDSTTASNNISMRTWKEERPDGKQVNLGYGFRSDYISDIYEKVNAEFQISADYATYEDILNYNREFFVTKYGEEKMPIFHEALLATCMYSMLKTAESVEAQTDAKKYSKFCRADKSTLPLVSLIDIKSEDDYNRYMKDYGRYLKSVKIPQLNHRSSIESFF